MNTDEALKVLGTPDNEYPSKEKKPHQYKQYDGEEHASLSSTAINRQITELELRKYEKDPSAYGQASSSASKTSSSFDFKRASILVAIPLLVFVGLNLDVGSEKPALTPAKRIEIDQSEPTLKAVIEIREQAKAEQNRLEQYFIDENLPLLNRAVSIGEKFQKAQSKEQAGSLQEAINTYSSVKLKYKKLLNSVRVATAQRKLAENSATNWNEYKQQNGVLDIPQVKQLDSLLNASNESFGDGRIDRAIAGYEGVTRLYKDLVEKVKPVVELRQKSIAAKNRWHSFRAEKMFSGKKIEEVDQPFTEANKLEAAGQLSKAAKSYRLAITAYESAMVNGDKLTSNNPWLKKMRTRLAEIEAEKKQNAKINQSTKAQTSSKTVTQITDQFDKSVLAGSIHYNIFHDTENWTMQTLAFDESSITIIEENENGENTSNTVSYSVKNGVLHLDNSRIFVKILSKNEKTEAIHTCWQDDIRSKFLCSGTQLEYLFSKKSSAKKFLARQTGRKINNGKTPVLVNEYYPLDSADQQALQMGQKTETVL